MSSATLFTAILEPLIFKRRLLVSEFILSGAIVAGIAVIIGFEPGYVPGILVGLTSAFLASLFNVLNGKHIRTMPSFQITKYEMLGGFITLALILGVTGDLNTETFNISKSDWIYLLILGLVCTTAAFLVSVWLMKFLSPFTVSMGINMEPIYAIMIALLLDFYRGDDGEKMTFGFYIGTIIIIGSIFFNAYLKKKKLTS
jgi:drug/metabolite transporter (DMT)-like permease